LTWTRITDPDEAASLLPAWLGSRMIGLRGRFGLVLTTGDVLRITSIGALHQSPTGIVLLDVLLDRGGIPDGLSARGTGSRLRRQRAYTRAGSQLLARSLTRSMPCQAKECRKGRSRGNSVFVPGLSFGFSRRKPHRRHTMALSPKALRQHAPVLLAHALRVRADAADARLQAIEARATAQAAKVSGDAHRANSEAATRRNDDRPTVARAHLKGPAETDRRPPG
jgi:hypothetical protein